MGDTMLISDC